MSAAAEPPIVRGTGPPPSKRRAAPPAAAVVGGDGHPAATRASSSFFSRPSPELVQWAAAGLAGVAGGVALRGGVGAAGSQRAQQWMFGASVLLVLALYVRQRFFVNIPYGVLQPILTAVMLLPLLLCVFLGTLLEAYALPDSRWTPGVALAVLVVAGGYALWPVVVAPLRRRASRHEQ
jgi:hypothetical protein